MSGFSFDSSAIRAYTGSTGPVGNSPRGNTGTTGSAGPVGITGFRGITGTSGPSIIGTFFETDPKEENFGYHVIQFSDYAGNIATASPKGLTGRPGPVIGGTAHFANTGGGKTGIFVDHGTYGITFGTGLLGVSGATLTFKRISGSGDISFYTNHALGIGTGATHTAIGLTGPKVHGYGGITSNSIGELAYLSDVKNVKDAHGLTFTTVGVTAGAGANGLTFGTVTAKFVNHSEHFHIHGNSITGVETNPFYIYTNTGNVHLLYPPFNLRGITLDFHSSRSPISHAPTWVGTKGTTADYGEAVSVTLIVDGGPRGIQFGDGFYFPKNGITFTQGRDIINCLSYDHGSSWFLSPAGFGFGITGPIEDQSDIGCCCNDSLQTCNDYITRSECHDFGDGYIFHNLQSCETTCNYEVQQDEEVNLIWGSCCVNADPNNQSNQAVCVGGTTAGNTADWMTQEKCEKFGGLFRRFVPCDFPCGDACDESFGTLGACCQFDANGNYLSCDQYTAFECNNVSIPGVASTTYAGDNTFCEQISCCSDELNYGACCLGNSSCIDNLTPIECASPVFNGIYMGHDSRCDRVSCVCEEPQPEKSVCIACYSAAGGNGCSCCNSQTVSSCINLFGQGQDGAVGINFWADGIACEDMIVDPPEACGGEYPCWNLIASYEAGLVNICGNPVGVPGTNPVQNCIAMDFGHQQEFYIGGYCCYTRRVEDSEDDWEVICSDTDGGVFGNIDGQGIVEQNCLCLIENGEDCGFTNGFGDGYEYKDAIWNGSSCSCPDPSDCKPVDNNPASDTFGMFIDVPLSGGGDERNMNIPIQELGSCCVYPTKDSCVSELEFSCFNVNATICNQIGNDLNRMYGEQAYGTRFTLGKCCCDSETCGGSSNSSSNNIGMGFNECMTAIHGNDSLECPGRYRDPSCQFLPQYVYHCNCSASTSTNTTDESAFVVESECGNKYCSPSGAVSDACSNCPVDSFEEGGACCCTDYTGDGFDSCPACSSCTYTTKQECLNKQFETNGCPDPIGHGGSYQCNCEFYPETTCGELAQDGICDAASEEQSDLEYTPLVIPKTHSRVLPAIVQSLDKLKAVPRSREQLSGVLCSDNNCEIIHDVHDYIIKNGSWPSLLDENGNYQVFLPHLPEVYTRLGKYGRIPTPVNETEKEQFIKAITTGGRTNRGMSIDEMVNLYSREDNKQLNKNHFNVMKMAYTVEKTITQSDPAGSYNWFVGNSDLNSYCACGDFEYDEIKIVKTKIQFPMISSPYGNSCIEINVPAGTENYIATKLGGIATTACSENTNKLYQFRNVIGKEKTILNKKTMQSTEPMVHCILPDGTRIRCSEDYCKNGLGGISRGKVTDLYDNHEYRKHSYEKRSYSFKKKDSE